MIIVANKPKPKNSERIDTQPTTPIDTVTPTKPKLIKIYVSYNYGFVPDNWINNQVVGESISFFRKADDWSTSKLSPSTINHGPLFPITIDYPINIVGNCPINAYFNTNNSGNQSISIRPLCKIPDVEESIRIGFRLGNCDRDNQQNLTCTRSGEFGTLKYKLYSSQNVFEFQYSGSWDIGYEGAINDSIRILGFPVPDQDYYRKCEENKIYTFNK